MEGQRSRALVARIWKKTLSCELHNSLNALCGSLCVSQKVVNGNSRIHIAAFLSVPNFPTQCRQTFATTSSKGEFLPELCFCMKVHMFPLVLPGKKSVFNPLGKLPCRWWYGSPQSQALATKQAVHSSSSEEEEQKGCASLVPQHPSPMNSVEDCHFRCFSRDTGT